MNRAFEQFCRTHFIQRNGGIGDLTANSSEAKYRKKELVANRLTIRRNRLSAQINDLYKEMHEQKAECESDNNLYRQKVAPILTRASQLKQEASDIQKQIKKLTSRRQNNGRRNQGNDS